VLQTSELRLAKLKEDLENRILSDLDQSFEDSDQVDCMMCRLQAGELIDGVDFKRYIYYFVQITILFVSTIEIPPVSPNNTGLFVTIGILHSRPGL